MFAGKTAVAIQLLIMGSKRGGVLHLGDIIPGLGKAYDILESKHPAAVLPHSDALISSDVASMDPVILDGSVIRAAALQALGATGPSGMDAYSWRKYYFHDLCSSIALLARQLCTTFVYPKIISSQTVCRLIAFHEQESCSISNWDW